MTTCSGKEFQIRGRQPEKLTTTTATNATTKITILYNWRHSVVVSVLSLINIVNSHWARLVLGWVIICGRVNRLGM